MTLTLKREQWEEGLTSVLEWFKAAPPATLLVVLTDDDGGYHMHHYMSGLAGDDNWDVSADVQNGTSEDVIQAMIMRRGV